MESLLVLNGHPEADGLTAELTGAYVAAAQSLVQVERIDLRELVFDLVLRRADQPFEPDLERASQALLRARHVTWIFPNWWGAPPALMKGFVDRVLRPGFAYRYRSRHAPPERLLRGRSARLITSMDSPGFWYQLVQGSPLHKGFVRGTLGFVGFDPVATTSFHEARFMDAKAHARARARVESAGLADARRVATRAARGLGVTPLLGDRAG
ncbi:MAG: NAD(P)H-dependent oxidoreductase [Myxococcales bacterium]